MNSEQFPTLSPERRESMIANTKDFIAALREGNLDEAEAWLDKVKAEPEHFPQYSGAWIDDRERELFHESAVRGDFARAKRVVEATSNPYSKEGRRKRLEEVAQKPFEEI